MSIPKVFTAYFVTAVASAAVVSYFDAYHVLTDREGLKFKTPEAIFEFQMGIWVPLAFVSSILIVASYAFCRSMWHSASCVSAFIGVAIAGAALPSIIYVCGRWVRSGGFSLVAMVVIPIAGAVMAAFAGRKMTDA